MRLIHLTSSGGWGGREMYPAALARLQSQRGHEVSLVAKKNTPLERFLAASDLDYDPLRVGPYLDPAAAWQLARILEKRAPRIIHIHLSRDLALVSLACSLARIRPAMILHKHIASAGNKRDILHRYLYGRLAAVVAVSEYVRRSLLESCPLKEKMVKVIFNGVDTGRFEMSQRESEPGRDSMRKELGAADPDTLLAGVVGRLEPRKGQEVFLEAAANLAARTEKLRFAVVGAAEGEYDRFLKDKCAALGLEGSMTFSGHRKDSRAVFTALDILVVPSFEEAFGLVAVEGMLAGLPVVAASSGALPEFIEHGRTGLLVPVRDSGALADTLERLAESSDLRRELGNRARAWAQENLSMERVLDRIDKLYEECISGFQDK